MQNENAVYQKVVESLKRRKSSTVADIAAATALPLSAVSELLPKAADEYSGHLRVTESGEILYYFPNVFSSRYRSFSAKIKKLVSRFTVFFKKALVLLFKIWIMVMLIGYFILFLLIALASVFLSVAARLNNNGSGTGGSNSEGSSFSFGLFDILFRIWFYSEITKPFNNYEDRYDKVPQKQKNPMHKAIFSFIFGEEDPNINWDDQKNKAVISYIQSNKGVISLVEYMTFSGLNSLEAQKEILSFCSKFEGSPELTQDATIVYRFDKLLLRSDNNNFNELLPPIKRLKIFSVNSKTKNIVFTLINTFNLIFGGYFFYQSFAAGQLLSEESYRSASNIYAYVHLLLGLIMPDPHNLIRIVLGLVPLLFSFFFWIIPLIRFFKEKKENENNKLQNFKIFGFNKIWSLLKNIDKFIFRTPVNECKVRDFNEAAQIVINDIGVISMPEIEINEEGREIYSFNELEKEKQALINYRLSIDTNKTKIGNTVFDSSD
ncbi:MAG: hypothetical protein FWB95_01200 [Treponema sp.]|nr:hypothetical protein [Treponema sp.]